MVNLSGNFNSPVNLECWKARPSILINPSGNINSPVKIDLLKELLLIIVNPSGKKEERAELAKALECLNEGDNYSIISEEGNIIEETDYAYISSFTDDNLASYREYSNRPLGVLKVDFEN